MATLARLSSVQRAVSGLEERCRVAEEEAKKRADLHVALAHAEDRYRNLEDRLRASEDKYRILEDDAARLRGAHTFVYIRTPTHTYAYAVH
jgi:hypothetical protein